MQPNCCAPLFLLAFWLHTCTLSVAWVVPVVQHSSVATFQHKKPLLIQCATKTESDEEESSDSTDTTDNTKTATTEKESTASAKVEGQDEEVEHEKEEDDDEYEYIEYDTLTEEDFLGSEWFVGTCWESNSNDIKETWVRLAAKEDKNIAVWGDNSEGSWSFDVASQFLAISKEYLWGKQIWAGVVEDYYFVQGTVRGWTYLTPASVLGQWQAKRLGVDPDEAGTAPWFEVEDDTEESKEEQPTEENAARN